MRSQRDRNIKLILHVKDHFSKYTPFYIMPNKKASTVVQLLHMFSLHCSIPKIILCDNSTEFKRTVILFMARYGINIINGRLQTIRHQGLVKEANYIMKDKLSKTIEATGNLKGLEHLICVPLAMNTQKHSSLPYNITLYEIFLIASIEIMITVQQHLLKSALGSSMLQMNR